MATKKKENKKAKKVSRPRKAKKAVPAVSKPSASKAGVQQPVKEKPRTRASSVQGKPIGRVLHYYDKIGVAVVKLSVPLRQGDSIRIEGGDRSFSQTVNSMESDHEKIMVAKKGSEIGIKVDQKAREGYKVYKA